MEIKKPFNWKIFFIVLAGCVWGVIAILPYSLALQQGKLDKLPMPLWALLPIQVIQNALLFAFAAGVGLFLAGRIGLGLPILEDWLAGQPVKKRILSILPVSLLLGVIGSILAVLLDVYVFGPALKAELGAKASLVNIQGAHPAAWQGLLASFYGGIDEEVLLRLFLMTLLAWLGSFLSKKANGQPTTAILWTANILAAVLFGLGHLPATAILIPLTPLVVIRAIVLNGLLGLAFGYLYWTRGLEAAMLSHFSADLVLHVLLAL